MITETIMPSVVHAGFGSIPGPQDEQSSMYRALFADIACEFPTYARDSLEYLLNRRVAEGVSFYLGTLPLLGKAAETSLISGERLLVPSEFNCRGSSGLPRFLNELFIELFYEDGMPRFDHLRTSGWSDRGVKACAFIRQVCMMWSKVADLPNPSAKTEEQAIAEFLDRVTLDPSITYSTSTVNALTEAHRLLGLVFPRRPQKSQDLLGFRKKPWGCHGPGAVSGREAPSEKWSFQRWPGLPEYLFTWAEGRVVTSTRLSEQPASRVTCVPKDFRGPRVICIEPKENQFAQQGLWKLLEAQIRRCELTRRSIDFRSVARSRDLCHDYEYATIDLKDASDKLALSLCRLLLPKWIFSMLTRYRTRKISVEQLNKLLVSYSSFATMGSAICFPIETLVFWALALGTMISIRDSFAPRQADRLNLDLRVFGDDIIVPLWACDAVCHAFSEVGLTVNDSKTCCFSPVRESCGEWVFMGKTIAIYRPKAFRIRSYASWLRWRDHLNDIAHGAFTPALTSTIMHAVVEKWKTFPTRYNRGLQRLEVRVPSMTIKGTRTRLADYAGLYAWHVGNDGVPFLKGTRNRVKMRWLGVEESLGSWLFLELKRRRALSGVRLNEFVF
jgi:hypothetical protein